MTGPSRTLPLIFVHVVTYDSASTIGRCLSAVRDQEGLPPGAVVTTVTDNASSDGPEPVVRTHHPGARYVQNRHNIGFSGAQNQGVKSFLDSDCDFFLALNPDVGLRRDALDRLVRAARGGPAAHSYCCKLLRAGADLDPLVPAVIDSAGMVLTRSLRHFDRGAGEPDRGQYDAPCRVFGGTGACLLLTREFVKKCLLEGLERERDSERLYPALSEGRGARAMLFDEAFFAYREDADLAWRASRLGLGCTYVPDAVGHHVRRVTPERRRSLPPHINRWGVRNRFLLQLNNFDFREMPGAVLPGVVARNLFVAVTACSAEWRSAGALRDVWKVRRRASERRRAVAGLIGSRNGCR